MAAGLGLDDTIIRRRIRQKLEFVAEDLARRIEPTDDDLAAYLSAHEDDFRIDPRLTFRQVYLDPERRGDALAADARELLVLLNADASVDAGALGDRTLLDHGNADYPLRMVAGLFGPEFAASIVDLDPGTWHGPIASGYGMHHVIVDERVAGRVPGLDEVRDEVLREWDNVRRVEAIDDFYDDLLDRYEIVIEWPAPAPGDAGS